MKIVAWLTEGTWPACVDATAEIAPSDAEIVFLHVIDPDVTEGVHGAYAGLFGRGGRGPDPGDVVESAARSAEAALFAAAEARLGRDVAGEARRGRSEREVIAVAEGAALLVVARDGDHSRLGPHSLGRPTRFVVDHAPCRVLLIWPDEPPALDTIPPPPEHHDRHGPPQNARRQQTRVGVGPRFGLLRESVRGGALPPARALRRFRRGSPVGLRRQELDLVGDDLERPAPEAVLTSPTAAVEAATNVDEPALGEMLGSDLSEAAPGDDVVELQARQSRG